MSTPVGPVGPDVALGLSPDFFEDTAGAVDWEVAFEVAFILDELDSSTVAIVGLETENEQRALIGLLPNYSDALRPEWRKVVAA